MNDIYDLTDQQLETLERRVDDGDAKSAVRLFEFYEFVANNSPEGLRWLRAAAQLGDINAEANLASILSEYPISKPEAVLWLEKAAKHGDEFAEKLLRKQTQASDMRVDVAAVSPADLDGIADAAFGAFWQQNVHPATPIKIFYLAGDDGLRVHTEKSTNPAFVLKKSSGYEFRDGCYRDKGTRQPCTVVAIKVASAEDRTAIAIVEWHNMRLTRGGAAYELRKVGSNWEIRKNVRSLVQDENGITRSDEAGR